MQCLWAEPCSIAACVLLQIPFIGWTGELPFLGQQLLRLLQVISAPTAAALFRRTGRQFFMLDGADDDLPVHHHALYNRGVATSFSGGGATAAGDGGAVVAAAATAPPRLPLLFQMTEDHPERGCYWYSGLASFKTRTAYANTGRWRLLLLVVFTPAYHTVM